MRLSTRLLAAWMLFGLAVCPMPSLAQEGDSQARSLFRDAFFAETHDGDAAKAAELYERTLEQDNLSEGIAREAKKRLAGIREELASADLAQLMPADAIVYAEIANPGNHVQHLAKMLNLVADADAQASGEAIEIEDGFVLPSHLAVSPALLAELEKVRGIAIALTEIDVTGRRPPSGLLVVHPGESDIVRGLFETSIQFVEPAAPIAGFKTHTYQQQVFVTQTERLVFVAADRGHIEQAIARLQSQGTGRLSNDPAFAKSRDADANALFHAWVNGQRVLPMVANQLRGEEAMIATALLDLQHLEGLSVTATTTDAGLAVQARLDLSDGHQNLLYGLIRTAPLTQKSLQFVPAGVAGVGILGLNPPAAGTSPSTSPSDQANADRNVRHLVSAMDLGREWFSNIQEVSVFVLPSVSGMIDREQVPDMGFVISSHNPDKSEALFGQLLSLPMIFLPELGAPADLEVAGLEGKVFRYPDAPPIALVRLGDDGIFLGTHGAAVAAAEAVSRGETIATDESFKPLISGLTDSSSKALLVDLGRALDTAALVVGRGDADELAMASQMVGSLHFSLVTDEQPTSLRVRGEVTDLPDVQQIIRTALVQQRRYVEMAMRQREAAMAARDHAVRAEREVVRRRAETEALRERVDSDGARGGEAEHGDAIDDSP